MCVKVPAVPAAAPPAIPGTTIGEEDENAALAAQQTNGHRGMVRCAKCFAAENGCNGILGHLQFQRCIKCWEAKFPCK